MGGSSGEVSRHLERFVQTGLVAVFDGRHYLSELGMRRAANMSRVLPSIIRSRHGAYLDRWYREHEEHHNDGVNRLVVRFAREGVAAVAGWRGEVNVPGLTQVRPDLLVQVSEGTLGTGTHCIEFERHAVQPFLVAEKLRPYRRMAASGMALPLLMVCETARGEQNFQAAGDRLPPWSGRWPGRSRCGATAASRRRPTAGRGRSDELQQVRLQSWPLAGKRGSRCPAAVPSPKAARVVPQPIAQPTSSSRRPV